MPFHNIHAEWLESREVEPFHKTCSFIQLFNQLLLDILRGFAEAVVDGD